MRTLTCLLLAGLVLAGCARSGGTHMSGQPGALAGTGMTNGAAAAGKFIVTAETMLVGKVVHVHENARFAVLNFPVGTMPAPQQHLNVYRHGLKVGEVKVTDLRQNDNTVADVVNGEVQVGDEIRGD